MNLCTPPFLLPPGGAGPLQTTRPSILMKEPAYRETISSPDSSLKTSRVLFSSGSDSVEEKVPMRIRCNGRKSLILITSVITALLIFSACERKVDTIKKTDILSLPTITGKDIKTVFSDSGKVQLILIAPLMQSYDNAESPYTEFKEGIKVIFFEGKKDTVATVAAKYAKYTNKDKLWELKDSVVVIGETKDKLETEELFWDQEKDIIYTDRFVKITSDSQIVMGTGLVSDSRLTKRKIKNVQGPIYLRDE
jgi:LPS export ABC transporter protein LptC